MRDGDLLEIMPHLKPIWRRKPRIRRKTLLDKIMVQRDFMDTVKRTT
jgi:hypothetical protein